MTRLLMLLPLLALACDATVAGKNDVLRFRYDADDNFLPSAFNTPIGVGLAARVEGAKPEAPEVVGGHRADVRTTCARAQPRRRPLTRGRDDPGRQAAGPGRARGAAASHASRSTSARSASAWYRSRFFRRRFVCGGMQAHVIFEGW